MRCKIVSLHSLFGAFCRCRVANYSRKQNYTANPIHCGVNSFNISYIAFRNFYFRIIPVFFNRFFAVDKAVKNTNRVIALQQPVYKYCTKVSAPANY